MFSFGVAAGKFAANELKKRALDIAKGVRKVATMEVRVGSSTQSKLLYIHCNGSPANNIPPRNVLQAAANDKNSSKEVRAQMRSAVMRALIGDLNGVDAAYEKAGMLAVTAVKSQFGIIPPPLKPETIRRKGSSATLIDTGSLMNSIDYQVVHK